MLKEVTKYKKIMQMRKNNICGHKRQEQTSHDVSVYGKRVEVEEDDLHLFAEIRINDNGYNKEDTM
jgi:hypothetical protein